MRKIILNLAISLDGLIEGPNGELDWLVRDENTDFADILDDILADKDMIFYGRASYEQWGNDQPDKNASDKLKAAYRLLHSKQKVVCSTTKTGDHTDAIFIGSDIRAQVSRIIAQPGKNIWLYGGAKLVTTFFNLGLIDVLKLAVHPVILGQGKRLFKNIRERHQLKLLEVKTHSSGITLMTYERAEAAIKVHLDPLTNNRI